MNRFSVLFSSSFTFRLLATVLTVGLVLSGCGGSGGGGGDNNSGNPPANQPPCAQGTVESGGVCVDQKFIFVSSQTMTGSFGGLTVADNLCASYATNAGLGGTWRAWLSDEVNDAFNRIADVGPWYLPGTSTIVVSNKAQLGTPQSGFINRTEFGVQLDFAAVPWPWSGSSSAGSRNSGYTCDGWTGSGAGGRLINMTANTPWGTDNPYYYGFCGGGGAYTGRLVCIEQ